MNDTNIGVGAYYDMPDEKEIERLTKKLNAWERWATEVLTDYKIPHDRHDE